MAPPSRDKVFISYSHKDQEWLAQLQSMMRPSDTAEIQPELLAHHFAEAGLNAPAVEY